MTRRWTFFRDAIQHTSIRFLDDRYRGLLMPMGQVLIWVIIAGVLLQVSEGTTLQYGGMPPFRVWVIAFAMGSLIAGTSFGFFFRPKLEVTRHLPSSPSAGDILSYRVTVKNVGKRIARNVAVQERLLPAEVRPVEEPPVILALKPGESADVTLKLSCILRGTYMLKKLQAASAFPSALVKFPRRAVNADMNAERLYVYPKIEPLDQLPIPLGRTYQPGGITSASRVGESAEFLGTREWRTSDRLRDVHWPSFARMGRPIVKDFQEEYFVRVALVIDTAVSTSFGEGAKEEHLFERMLSFVAGAAYLLAREDAVIDLVAAGTEIFRFQAGRALGHVDQVLEVLAAIEMTDELDVVALEKAIVPEASMFSAVLFVFVTWDEERARLVERFRSIGVAVRVLVARQDMQPTGLSSEEIVELPPIESEKKR